jgi:hypothetical protein
MRARQKRPKTAVDQCLSILFRNTRDLELQLFELNKLRYQVWHRPGIEPGRTPEPAGQTPHQRESCRGYPLISARSHPTIGIELSRDNLDENGASIWVRRGSRAEG